VAEALLNTPAESILPIIINHTDYGPVNHELRMTLLSLYSPLLAEEENNNKNNVVDFTEAGLKEAAKQFHPGCVGVWCYCCCGRCCDQCMELVRCLCGI
jgi:hypothetical protein